MYAASAHAAELIERVREHRRRVLLRGRITCSVCADARRRTGSASSTGSARRPVIEVPNGADPARVAFTAARRAPARDASLGLGDEQLAVFVGSWHEPNLVVDPRPARHRARSSRASACCICGSAGLAFADQPMPGNFDLCGVVDDGSWPACWASPTSALNPMRSGPGRNLKMLDYALAGVPLVSSRFGARGLDLEPGRHYLETDRRRAARGAGGAARVEPPRTTDARVRAAREHVDDAASRWRPIAAAWRAHPALRDLLEPSEVPA